MAIDASFKNYLNDLIRKKLDLQTSVKVGKLPLEIDIILGRTQEKTQLDILGLRAFQIVFDESNSEHLVIEYKSGSDYLVATDLSKIHAYKHLLIVRDDKHEIRNTVSLILTTDVHPDLLNSMKKRELAQGIYEVTYDGTIYMIIINELEVTFANYGLLMFSTGEVQETFVREILYAMIGKSNDRVEENFISKVIQYNYEVLEKVAKAEGIPLDQISINIRKAIAQVGLASVLEEFDIKEILKNLSPEQKKDLEKIIKETSNDV